MKLLTRYSHNGHTTSDTSHRHGPSNEGSFTVNCSSYYDVPPSQIEEPRLKVVEVVVTTVHLCPDAPSKPKHLQRLHARTGAHRIPSQQASRLPAFSTGAVQNHSSEQGLQPAVSSITGLLCIGSIVFAASQACGRFAIKMYGEAAGC